MKKIQHSLLFLVILAIILQACSKHQDTEEAAADTPRIKETPSAAIDGEEPVLLITLDEDKDVAMLTANRDIDQQSVEKAVQSTFWVTRKDKAVKAEYIIDSIDSRRMDIRFPNLPQGAMVQSKVEGAKAMDGAPFRVQSPQDGLVITMWQGIAWSGFRWLDTTGRTVRERAMNSAAFVQPSGDGEKDWLIYTHDQTVFRFNLESGDMKDVTIQDWKEDKSKYYSEYGTNVIYSYPVGREGFYAAKGLQTIYYVNAADNKSQLIYESERPIYGMASSPDGQYIAVLLDSESNLGPYADLLVIDAKGEVISEFLRAAYMGHSEGWHFIYPVRWMDKETIAVPLVGSSAESFFRGKALFHYRKGHLSNEADPALPEDAVALLNSEIDDLDGLEINQVLPKPNDLSRRYYAVSLTDGSYLIDREEKKVMQLGFGTLAGWTPGGQVVVWHSTEGKSVNWVGIE
ncbi:TolB-like translocation protein [Paenibacillus kobensis]|uniref:hypothetical protein n=1 Tax=Paenibacillus kobensis TaxID=59841 RepID=UPI000FD952A1|nr:hypothetical protein [Paenibacillus kobensis]